MHTVNEVSVREITREQSFGGAIELAARVAGLSLKELQAELCLDKAQLSRWKDGSEGIKQDKLFALMDCCGNDAPLLWLLHARGYDLASVRKLETETEQLLRLAREEIETLKREQAVTMKVLREMRGGE